MSLEFSLVIPVYNRPDEIRELFESLVEQTFQRPFEIVLVEDGSQKTAAQEVEDFRDRLTISYLKKNNSGPGDSRNFGMRKARGNYFLLVDSDCVLPPDYLEQIDLALSKEFIHCFGGPDAADSSFTLLQRAISYSMTSYWTTGGIRGHRRHAHSFQPRSFNMGISREAFEASGGFGNIHPGEDPDLSLRLRKMGYHTNYIAEVLVFHKRRISFSAFYRQMRKFGLARPILNKWHPESKKITYWFPAIFTIFFAVSIILFLYGLYWPLVLYAIYGLIIFIDSWRLNSNIGVAFLSVLAVLIQFYAYGLGFLKSYFLVNFSKKKPEELIPELFFEPTLS